MGKSFIAGIIFLAALPIAALSSETGAKDAAVSFSSVRVKPLAGIFFPRGAGLDASYTAGLNFEWDVNGVANLRLGYERANPDIAGGNDLEITRVPLLIMSKMEEDRLPGNAYFGFGGAYTEVTYDKQPFLLNHNNVHNIGLLLLVGVELNKKLALELKYDLLRKNAMDYGGVSLYLIYGRF